MLKDIWVQNASLADCAPEISIPFLINRIDLEYKMIKPLH